MSRWIFEDYRLPPASLGVYRILFGIYVLFVLSPGHGSSTRFQHLASFPDAFYYPPFGPMRLLSGFPTELFFEALVLALNLSAVALLIGYRTRWASVTTGALLFVGFGYLYSLGKINHNILVLIIPFAMAVTGWGARYSWDALRRDAGASTVRVRVWPITLVSLCVGFSMFASGMNKLLTGWLDPSAQAVQGHLHRLYYVSGSQDLLAPFFLNLDTHFFWESLDYSTVALEVGFLAACFHPTMFRLFCGIAVLFHFGVAVMMNIIFTSNLVAYGLFVNWNRFEVWRIAPRLKPNISEGWKGEALAGAIVASMGTGFYLFGSPFLWMETTEIFTSDMGAAEILLIIGALGVVVAAAALWGRDRFLTYDP